MRKDIPFCILQHKIGYSLLLHATKERIFPSAFCNMRKDIPFCILQYSPRKLYTKSRRNSPTKFVGEILLKKYLTKFAREILLQNLLEKLSYKIFWRNSPTKISNYF
jgi:hypothetical protein